MERWRPRRLARRRLAAGPPNPQQLLVTRRPRKPPIRRRDAAEPAGGTPAFRRATFGVAMTPDRIAAMNRRKFIGASATLAALSRTPSLFAQSEGSKLPPSIAALTSMRDPAKPITT